MDARFDPGLATVIEDLAARHPVVGLAAVVVRDGEPARLAVHGLAYPQTGRPVTTDTVFRVASITKVFTAIAVMQLRERGLLDLDDPVEQHLRGLRIDPGGHGAPTIRHLLTHTAGLGELARPWGAFLPDFGESVPAGAPLPTLTEFYGGAVRLHAEPGTRFVYSNHAPTVLGQVVEDITGRTLADYVAAHVFAPLGMTGSTLNRPTGAALATGHEIGPRGVRTIPERDMVTAGAASGYSTPADMARFVAALLAGGRGAGGAVLTPGSLALMVAPQYRPDPLVPGMGLGFFRRQIGGVEVVGHQGTHPGFHAQFFAAPDEGLGVVLLTNGTRDADFWLPTATAGILADELGVPRPALRTDLPQRPDVWDDLRGWYSLPARLTDTRLRGMMGAGVEVFVAGGALRLRFLTLIPQLARGFVLHPDDPVEPRVFRADLGVDGLEPMRFVFARGPGPAAAVTLDAMPLVLPRRSQSSNPRRWALAGLGTAALVGVRLAARPRGRTTTQGRTT